MRPHLPDDELTPDAVPAADAPWAAISDFGHRYHAYRVAGSLQRVADLTLEAHDRWSEDGTLPEALPRLRLALFHTVRASHGDVPTSGTEDWARALVGAIGHAVRGRSRGPAPARPEEPSGVRLED